MKFIEKYEHGEPVFKEIKWADHWPSCEQCREVNIEQSATFPRSCAQGAILLTEELKKRQAPVQREKTKENQEWAKKTGVFAEFDRGSIAEVKAITKYK